jgi:alkanesulfonate monooxygenase SsuD/methylene tetrahydromethanopterin reductase-like flavin-dependent oxidoreductase (luciferase family)
MAVQFGYVMTEGPAKGAPPESYFDLIDGVVADLGPALDSLWMTDHLMWGDEPTYEAWTTLAYVASRYPRLRVGPIVLGQSYRNPALLAKMAATLQNLSGGRLIFALGAGWKEDEYAAYGFDYPSGGTRIDQLEEALIICRKMWTEPGRVSYAGEHYTVQDAYCEPKPDPPPPVLVGGTGSKTMRVAARRADWWNMPDSGVEVCVELVDRLKHQCEAVGRDPSTLRLTWFGRLCVADTYDEAVALTGGKRTRENGIVGAPDQVIAQMRALVDLGVDYFMCMVPGLPDAERMRLLREEVLPAVGASG